MATPKACDVVELAQTYTRRWPVQENIIRDLITLCQRVNEQQVRLPDGRLLVFSVKEICRPILHGQKRRIDWHPDDTGRGVLKSLLIFCSRSSTSLRYLFGSFGGGT